MSWLFLSFAAHYTVYIWLPMPNKKLSWCWQIRATRLEVSQGHQTRYHSTR